MAVFFDLSVDETSESIHSSLAVLLETENVGIAVGIVLLTDEQAAINIC